MYFVNPSMTVDVLHASFEDAMNEVKEVAVTHPNNMQLIFKLEKIYKPDVSTIQVNEVTIEDFEADKKKREDERNEWMRSIGMLDE